MAKTDDTDEQRHEALALYVEHGPAEAERRTCIPKQAVASWAYRSGVQTNAPTKIDWTEAARTKRQYDREQFKAKMAAALAEVAKTAVAEELRILTSDEVSLEKVVGGSTRAFRDLQLLEDEAMSRTEQTTPDQFTAYLLGAREAFDQRDRPGRAALPDRA